MKEKLTAVFLLLVMTILTPLSEYGAYAYDSNYIFDASASLSDSDRAKFFRIIANAISDDYTSEIRDAVSDISSSGKEVLEENGFISGSNVAPMEEVFLAISQIMDPGGDYRDGYDGDSFFWVGVDIGKDDDSSNEARKKCIEISEYLFESLPGEVKEGDFARYGGTAEGGKLVRDILTETFGQGDICSKYYKGSGRFEIVLPDNFLESANRALKQDVDDPLVLDLDHEEAIQAFIDVFNQKINDNGDALDAKDIAAKLQIVEIIGGGSSGGDHGAVAEDKEEEGIITKWEDEDSAHVQNNVGFVVQKDTSSETLKVNVDEEQLEDEVARVIDTMAAQEQQGDLQSQGELFVDLGSVENGHTEIGIPVGALEAALESDVSLRFKGNNVEIIMPVENVDRDSTVMRMEVDKEEDTAKLADSIARTLQQNENMPQIKQAITLNLCCVHAGGHEDMMSNFEKEMDIEIDLSHTGIDPKRAVLVSVCCDDSNEQAMEIVGSKIVGGKLVAHVSRAGTYALIQRDLHFADVQDHWSHQYVDSLGCKGVLSGYSGGSFNPDGLVTRAEFARMMVMATDCRQAEGADFSDIGSHWAKECIETAHANGFIKGYDDGTFRPDKTISRAEMALMAARAVKAKENYVDVPEFKDGDLIPAWADTGVEKSVGTGLMEGDTKGLFNPQGYTTRGEAAAVIYRIFYKDI
ncbi:S-layer homology domain-containing protein [Peptoclostridium litorale DSM 5388]|uniref:Amylopullulanase AmyB n=1 Tax=Peptoclostridium litorale DSM 5388 TaxID=1121324 RepID=A0A069RC99_PEPLI|nr:S-layer homology domain-containing protein [Peptoclostridium litorale]KDR94669.1 amylopullulanase AmyB [Peptoclostridium litorale DSM 5388]SIO29999.1 S-layer homology domain-containing protein [Peptoclostridium litorale DSM 5388]